MWQTNTPQPVKLIIGILAADQESLDAAVQKIKTVFGEVDLASEAWQFDFTTYYKAETGEHILRQFVTIKELVDPGELAGIKHRSNELERELATELNKPVPRPVNLDPGLIEPAKLVLATTKNYAHRIYIGQSMWAEVTLIFEKGGWTYMPYTYPDYRSAKYMAFFGLVRNRLLEQLKSNR